MPCSLPGAAEWYQSEIKTGTNGQASGPAVDGEPDSPTIRRLKAQADHETAKAARAELELQLRRNELVERSVAEREMMLLITLVKRRVEALPDEIAGVIPPEHRPGVARSVREIVERMLIELAEAGATKP